MPRKDPASGLFEIPAKINFEDSGAGNHNETASLEDGGTGAEAYHQWTATYTATGSIVIDIIELWTAPGAEGGKVYTQDDITDKSLENTETLQAHVKITHA